MESIAILNTTSTVSTSGTEGFDLLSRLTTGYDGIILLGAPTLLLLIVAIIFYILIQRKSRKESRDLLSSSNSVPAAEDANSDDSEEDLSGGIYAAELESLEAPAELDTEKPKVPGLTVEKPAPDEVTEILTVGKTSWLDVLKKGLSRTRSAIGSGLAELFSGSAKIDAALLEKFHETLYRADIGVRATDKLVASIKSEFGNSAAPSWNDVQSHLVAEISAIFKTNDRPLIIPDKPPHVILVVGVNGVGKTTTIGKLSARFMAEGKSVLLGAADTYRAAAIEQLEVWGKRLGVDVIRQQQGSDPAAVAYDALKAAVAREKEILIIDTAGRLHNKTELMDELGKIHRVLGRDVPGAPHETWLVIDATTGQNASTQVKAFKEVASITGLVVTKLDGTAKGGVLIGIAEQFNIPIRFIGVGEKASDLQPFNAEEFAKALF